MTNRSRLVCSLIGCAILALAPFRPSTTEARAEQAAQKMLPSTDGSAEQGPEKIALCVSCHGEGGLPSDPDIPIIAGQEFYYLYVQLRDYKAGRRQNPVMSSIVASLSKEEMRSLARHFSQRDWPRIGFAAEATDIAKGESATAAGLCVQCHLGGYEGDSRVPRLAGQHPRYLERTMLEFKDRKRLNSPAKTSLLATYDEADIAAMARYLAGF